jgi:transposase-like protein
MPRKRTRDDRARVVREWDASGLTAGEFARRQGIGPETLRVWGRQVRGPLRGGALRTLQSRSPRRPIPEAVELVEVGLVAPAAATEQQVEILLRDGRHIHVVGTWTTEMIAALVGALDPA